MEQPFDRHDYHIAQLLARRAEGIMTPAESEELERWCAVSQANRDLCELWNDRRRIGAVLARYAEIDSDGAAREGMRRIAARAKRPVRRAMRIAVAAACVAAVAMTSVIVISNKHKERAADPIIAAGECPVPVLILEDGTTVPIDSMTAGAGAVPGNVDVAGASALVYEREGAAGAAMISRHTLSVPRGRQLDVVLPDGTHVWINAGSRIHFPTRFAAGDRTVELEGEAYFDVTEQPERPFNVVLAQGTITVRGTEFNVAGYGRSSVAATLVSGKIDFRAESGRGVSLTAGQRVTYSGEGDELAVEEVNVKPYIAWRDNVFHFEGRPLAQIAGELERWYGVRFEFAEPALADLRLSMHVGRDEDLETLLGLFERGARVKFTVRDDAVTVATP